MTIVALTEVWAQEVLVYNMSHADLFLSYSSKFKQRLARPGYNQFEQVGKAVTDYLEEHRPGDGREGVVWHTAANGAELPLGFEVDVEVGAAQLRVRGRHDSQWNNPNNRSHTSFPDPDQSTVKIKAVSQPV